MVRHDIIVIGASSGLERALWSAVRSFDERANLERRLGERKFHSESVGKNWEARAKELERHAKVIRELLEANQRD